MCFDLERLDERPEKNTYRVSLSQQFDETSRSKQSQKPQAHEAVLQRHQ